MALKIEEMPLLCDQKRLFKSFILLALAIGLSLTLGCANLEKTECENTHWPTQGFKDGSEGRYSRVSMFLAKCSPYSISVNTDSYLESYDKGLDQFCGEESAFSRGFQGLAPEKICENSKKYKISYETGTQNYCSSEVGQDDAKNAKPARLFCSRDSNYFQGYQDGLKGFCTEENGYSFGFEGKEETKICKGKLLLSFYTGFKRGRIDFLKKDNQRIQGDIELMEKELYLVKERFTESLSEAYEIPSSSQDPYVVEKRLKLDTEIKLLKEKKSNVEQEIFNSRKLINDNNSEIGRLN